jgi:hypothetical protein
MQETGIAWIRFLKRTSRYHFQDLKDDKIERFSALECAPGREVDSATLRRRTKNRRYAIEDPMKLIGRTARRDQQIQLSGLLSGLLR